jgi:excisionase family DNA binding protein
MNLNDSQTETAIAVALSEWGSGGDVLAVSPARAARVLDCCRARIYELLQQGELESYKDGAKLRKITVRSLRSYVERRLAQTAAEDNTLHR